MQLTGSSSGAAPGKVVAAPSSQSVPWSTGAWAARRSPKSSPSASLMQAMGTLSFGAAPGKAVASIGVAVPAAEDPGIVALRVVPVRIQAT